MTTYTQQGYLDRDYLNHKYLDGFVHLVHGMQFEVTINSDRPSSLQFEAQINQEKNQSVQFEANINQQRSAAMQFLTEILDFRSVRGIQALSQIAKQHGYGFQTHLIINQEKGNSLQFEVGTSNPGEARGFQFEANMVKDRSLSVEFRKDAYQSFQITGYLEDEYLGTPYLTGWFGPRIPFQFNAAISLPKFEGFQFETFINDKTKANCVQFLSNIKDKPHDCSLQFKILNTQGHEMGFQFLSRIMDMLDSHGFQFQGVIRDEHPFGVQFQSVTQKAYGLQFLATVYNTKYLRILHNFKSRGLTNTNWSSNTSYPGDFGPNNLDTDIVEQVWRSEYGAKSSIKLTCDVGLNQTCYMDTLAILNHNMTVGANILVAMSNDPAFLVGVEYVTVSSRKYDTYYIAPSLPIRGYRYFQIQIDDPTNTDPWIQIGCIMFGNADIIHGENFTDEVDFEMVDFSDTVNTEGFTNVTNSRALKRKLSLNFQSLQYDKRNYQILRNVYETYRTSHKCLWIPTPDVLNQNITDRLRIFGKLITVPKERHNNKGPGADYVSFQVDLDESL